MRKYFLCWREMDMKSRGYDYVRMVRRPPNRRKAPRAARPLYIGQWIRALGFTQRAIVKSSGLNEGYISQLVNGEKDNPSADVVMLIADALEIPMNLLYQPPPDKEFIAQAAKLDPSIIGRLRKQ